MPPFTEPVDFRFDERVNLFVGANATGRSRLLSAVDDYFNEKTTAYYWGGDFINRDFDRTEARELISSTYQSQKWN